MTDVTQGGLSGGGSSAFVEEDSLTTAQGGQDDQKYWQVEVEHPGPGTFVAGARTNPQNYNSFLRLGTASGSTSNNEGADLQTYVTSFYDDNRWTGNASTTNQLTAGLRTSETGILYTKGGWRSHTEGNRVDTTRGDKVEVVRGNYQMVVLGRQDNAGHSSRYEASGGHFSRDDQNLTPGAIYEISFYTDSEYGNTWTTIEETVNGHHVSRYHGDILEEYYGKEIKTYIGDGSAGTIPQGSRSTSGGAGNADKRFNWLSPDGTQNKINPNIEEHIWAKSLKMRERYGSTNGDWKAVYKLTQNDNGTKEEWEGRYEEDWNAKSHSFDSNIYNVETFKESVAANKVVSTVTAKGAIAETRAAGGTITDTDTSSTIHSFSLALVEQTAITTGIINNDTTIAGLNLDITVAGINLGLAATKVNLDTNLSKIALNITKAGYLGDLAVAGYVTEMVVGTMRHESVVGGADVRQVTGNCITAGLVHMII